MLLWLSTTYCIGLKVAQVWVIFSLPEEYGTFHHPLAYVKWFTPFHKPVHELGMYQISWSTHSGYQQALIIPVSQVEWLAHLILKFSRQIDHTWTSDDVDMPKGCSCDRKQQAKEDWIRAVALLRAEIDNHTQRCMWELVPLPKGRKAIGSQWTYSIKFNSDSSITRYKACLVAQGFSQVISINYYDTFVLTVWLETVCALLHLTAAHGWFCGQDDVVVAFLFGDLEEEIFMRQLEGFEDGTNRVAKLLRSLYGLKQAAWVWNKLLHKELVAAGYLQLISDSAVYIRKADHITILVIHVDNIISFRSGKSSLDDTCTKLHRIFKMKEEDPNWLMGFKLIENCNEGTIAIDHSLYIDTILQRFGMENCNPTRTPLDPGTLLSTDDCPTTKDKKAVMMNVPYRELIGALTWIAVVSHPDIAFMTTYLAWFNANPGLTHWKAAKHVLQYLNGTKQHYLMLGLQSSNLNELTVFTDSDWGHDIVNQHLVSGYVFMLGDSATSWKAKQQPTVAASSTEVEYMSVLQMARHGLWIRRLLIELGLNHIELDPTTVFLDNCSAINLSKESHHHNRTKHIDIQHHFIREHVEDGTFHIIHCPTHLMLADAPTKPLPFPTFSHCRDGLGLISNWGGVLECRYNSYRLVIHIRSDY